MDGRRGIDAKDLLQEAFQLGSFFCSRSARSGFLPVRGRPITPVPDHDKLGLLRLRKLVELGFAQVVVDASEVVPHAPDRVHARCVASNVVVHCLLRLRGRLLWLLLLGRVGSSSGGGGRWCRGGGSLLSSSFWLVSRRLCTWGGNRNVIRLVVVRQLVELGLAQVVVVARHLVPSAFDRIHARNVANDTVVDSVLGWLGWRWWCSWCWWCWREW